MEHSWNCTPKWRKLLMWSLGVYVENTTPKTVFQGTCKSMVIDCHLGWYSTATSKLGTPKTQPHKESLDFSEGKFMTYLKHAKSSSFMVSNVDFHVPNGLWTDYEWMSRLGGGYLALTSALQTLDFTQSPPSAAPSTTCGYSGCSGC